MLTVSTQLHRSEIGLNILIDWQCSYMLTAQYSTVLSALRFLYIVWKP